MSYDQRPNHFMSSNVVAAPHYNSAFFRTKWKPVIVYKIARCWECPIMTYLYLFVFQYRIIYFLIYNNTLIETVKHSTIPACPSKANPSE